MAANDPGVPPLGALYPAAGENEKETDVSNSGNGVDAGLGKGAAKGVEEVVAPDQFDEHYETSKREIWSYYAYYIGNNGLTLFSKTFRKV